MNIRPEVPAFQVDTGPLLVPDFTSAQANLIDRLELAHVAYNRLDRAALAFGIRHHVIAAQCDTPDEPNRSMMPKTRLQSIPGA
jgi:hypothetical protein